MDDLARAGGRPARDGMALCVDVVVNHTAREHAWAQAALGGRRGHARLLPHVRGPRRSPTPTRRRCPRSSPTSPPAASPTSEELGRWVWTTFNDVPVGPRLLQPRGVRGDGGGDARPRRRRRGRAAPRRGAVPVEAAGHQLPEPARGPPAAAGVPRGAADRRPGGGVQGGGDRRPRATSSRYLGDGRHEGKECDLAYHNVLMVLGWSALPPAAWRLLTQHAAGDAARAARARAG